jgi:hypothetical protein
MRSGLLSSAVLLVCAAAGCQKDTGLYPPRAAIPPASDVKEARLQSMGGGDKGTGVEAKYDVTLTREADIAALVGWLQRVDWSPSRAGLAGVGLETGQKATGQITLTTKDGATHSFELWNRGVILLGSGRRWTWETDTAPLADIARQAGANAP